MSPRAIRVLIAIGSWQHLYVCLSFGRSPSIPPECCATAVFEVIELCQGCYQKRRLLVRPGRKTESKSKSEGLQLTFCWAEQVGVPRAE